MVFLLANQTRFHLYRARFCQKKLKNAKRGGARGTHLPPDLFVCLRRDVTVARRGVTNRFDRSLPNGSERNRAEWTSPARFPCGRHPVAERPTGMKWNAAKLKPRGQKQTRPELPESARNFVFLAHPSETNSDFTSSSPGRPPRYPAEPRTLTLGVADGWGRPPCEAAGWRKGTPVSLSRACPAPHLATTHINVGAAATDTHRARHRPSVRRRPANLEASARVPCPHRALPLVAGPLTRRQRQARVNAPPAMAMAHMSDGEIGTATGTLPCCSVKL